MSTERERLVLLDAIRVAAITLVVGVHIAQRTGSPLGGFFGVPGIYYTSLGGVGVTLFLVLSGLALELRYRHRDVAFWRFLLSRCKRIYPVYYMSLPIGFAVLLLKYYVGREAATTAIANLGWPDVFLTITGFYAFAGEWGGPFVRTSWFIGLIMSMYALYPFLSKAVRARPHTTFAILLLVSLASRIALGRDEILPYWPQDWFPLCRVWEFSLGIWLATVLADGVWSALNGVGRLKPVLATASKLSFPLFLVHFPLVAMVPYLAAYGLPTPSAVLLYLLVSLTASAILLTADNALQRSCRRGCTDTGDRPGDDAQVRPDRAWAPQEHMPASAMGSNDSAGHLGLK